MTNRCREYDVITRGRVGPMQVAAFVDHLEWTEATVWLSREARCRRATLRGVPARRVDVLVDQRILDGAPADPRDLLVAEVGLKAGRYDGAQRPRIALRQVRGSCARDWPALDLRVTIEPGTERVPEAITVRLGDWSGSWDRMRMTLDPDGAGRIIAWHWSRWYSHLPQADVQWLLDTWGPSEGATLAEANRQASRVLYKASTLAGWRKVTLRERRRIGLDDDEPQWQRVERLDELRALRAGYSTAGVGEHTLAAARGPEAPVIRMERVRRAQVEEAWEHGEDHALG